MPNVAISLGYIYHRIYNLYQSLEPNSVSTVSGVNILRPYSIYTVPVTLTDALTGNPVTLQRRNFSEATTRGYLGAVERFARFFGKPPDRLGPDHIRQWQAHLLHQRKLAVGTVVNQVAALRFFFRRVLKRRLPADSIPYPRYIHHRTPRVLEHGRSGPSDRVSR